VSGDINLSSMYKGLGDVSTGGYNAESASQQGGKSGMSGQEQKIAGWGALATSVISAVGAMKVGKLQEKQFKFAEQARRSEKELRTAQRMGVFGDQSELRRRAKESATVDAQFAQAMSGLKREGSALAAEEVSEINYSEDELAARKSLASAEFADEYKTRGDIFALKGERKQMRANRRGEQGESLVKMAGLGADLYKAYNS
jgi:hypothetical protein